MNGAAVPLYKLAKKAMMTWGVISQVIGVIGHE